MARRSSSSPTLHGVIVVDKPQGITSHDVVARVRRTLKTREVGHAGTLDPMATGVLVIAVGEATKLVSYLTAADKFYDAQLRFGIATDSLDADGNVTEQAPLPDELARALRQPEGDVPPLLARALAHECARREQVPPQFSAIKKDGERAYAAAREGRSVELAPRAVRILDAQITRWASDPSPTANVSLHVTKGFYVRAFARDFSRSLGTVAHLTFLRRTASGAFSLEHACPSPEDPASLVRSMLSVGEAARLALPEATLSEQGVIDARHGRRIQAPDVACNRDGTDGVHALFDSTGTLVALGERGEDGWRVVRGFQRTPNADNADDGAKEGT